jgi:hypothetical protein
MGALGLIFRGLLLIAFGVLSLVVALILTREPGWELMLMLAVLVVAMLRVGGSKAEAITAAQWKISLPTDDPRIAGFLLGLCLAAFSLYRAWDAYTNPFHKFERLEKTIVTLLGTDGVIAFWIAMSGGCLAGAIHHFRQHRRPRLS